MNSAFSSKKKFSVLNYFKRNKNNEFEKFLTRRLWQNSTVIQIKATMESQKMIIIRVITSQNLN